MFHNCHRHSDNRQSAEHPADGQRYATNTTTAKKQSNQCSVPTSPKARPTPSKNKAIINSTIRFHPPKGSANEIHHQRKGRNIKKGQRSSKEHQKKVKDRQKNVKDRQKNVKDRQKIVKRTSKDRQRLSK